MMEDNLAFEWMIHMMELGVVLGIAIVVYFIKTRNKNSRQKSHDSTKNQKLGS